MSDISYYLGSINLNDGMHFFVDRDGVNLGQKQKTWSSRKRATDGAEVQYNVQTGGLIPCVIPMWIEADDDGELQYLEESLWTEVDKSTNTLLAFHPNMCDQPSPVGNVMPSHWGDSSGRWVASGGKFHGLGDASTHDCYYVYAAPASSIPVYPGVVYNVGHYSNLTSYTSGSCATAIWVYNASGAVIASSWVDHITTWRAAGDGWHTLNYTMPGGAARCQLHNILDASSTLTFDVWSWVFRTMETFTIVESTRPETIIRDNGYVLNYRAEFTLVLMRTP